MTLPPLPVPLLIAAMLLSAPAAHARSASAPDAKESPELVTPSESPSEESAFQPDVPRALLAGAGSLVPGLLVHGAGPFLAGDEKGALTLLAAEGAALGIAAAGFIPIALTGASRYPIAPLYVLAGAGIGLFSISALSNVYSAATLVVEPGVPLARLPPLELELGYLGLSDPLFAYAHLATVGATGWIGRLRLHGIGHFALDHDHQRGRATAAWRFFGPTGSSDEGDGTYLELELGGGHQRFLPEGFRATGADLLVRGRYSLGRVSHRLRGAFGELGAGYGFHAIRYAHRHTDLVDMLLLELGFGVNLGRTGPLRGEAMVFYDHRRDSFARALTIGSGIVGSFGLRSKLYLTESWGVLGEAAVGAAWVGRVSAIYHFGGQR